MSDFYKNLAHLLEKKITASDENENPARANDSANFTSENLAGNVQDNKVFSEKNARNFFEKFSKEKKTGNVIKENAKIRRLIAVPAEVKKACTSLGVLPNQKLSEIKKMWKAKMKTFHPDASESDTNEKARNLIHAYKIIEKWKKK